MDMQLRKLIDERRDEKRDLEFATNYQTGEIIIVKGSEHAKHPLRPLSELYGVGLNREALNPQDEAYRPLLQGIESEIVSHDNDCDEDGEELTDNLVLVELKTLANDLERTFGPDHAIAHRVQTALRIVLSLHDYSRRDVRQALRCVCKSIELHTRQGGLRGYLDFIGEYVE
jgi:hypothetical protein